MSAWTISSATLPSRTTTRAPKRRARIPSPSLPAAVTALDLLARRFDAFVAAEAERELASKDAADPLAIVDRFYHRGARSAFEEAARYTRETADALAPGLRELLALEETERPHLHVVNGDARDAL